MAKVSSRDGMSCSWSWSWDDFAALRRASQYFLRLIWWRWSWWWRWDLQAAFPRPSWTSTAPVTGGRAYLLSPSSSSRGGAGLGNTNGMTSDKFWSSLITMMVLLFFSCCSRRYCRRNSSRCLRWAFWCPPKACEVGKDMEQVEHVKGPELKFNHAAISDGEDDLLVFANHGPFVELSVELVFPNILIWRKLLWRRENRKRVMIYEREERWRRRV